MGRLKAQKAKKHFYFSFFPTTKSNSEIKTCQTTSNNVPNNSLLLLEAVSNFHSPFFPSIGVLSGKRSWEGWRNWNWSVAQKKLIPIPHTIFDCLTSNKFAISTFSASQEYSNFKKQFQPNKPRMSVLPSSPDDLNMPKLSNGSDFQQFSKSFLPKLPVSLHHSRPEKNTFRLS